MAFADQTVELVLKVRDEGLAQFALMAGALKGMETAIGNVRDTARQWSAAEGANLEKSVRNLGEGFARTGERVQEFASRVSGMEGSSSVLDRAIGRLTSDLSGGLGSSLRDTGALVERLSPAFANATHESEGFGGALQAARDAAGRFGDGVDQVRNISLQTEGSQTRLEGAVRRVGEAVSGVGGDLEDFRTRMVNAERDTSILDRAISNLAARAAGNLGQDILGLGQRIDRLAPAFTEATRVTERWGGALRDTDTSGTVLDRTAGRLNMTIVTGITRGVEGLVASLVRLPGHIAEAIGWFTRLRTGTEGATKAAEQMSFGFVDSMEKVATSTTAAGNAATRATGSGGIGGGGIYGFIQGLLPGQQTAGNFILALLGLGAAFAPLSAELLASTYLMGAWVVGATALAATVTLALGPLFALAGAFVALGIAQTGGLDPHQQYIDLQKQLKTVTNSNEAAQEALAKAQTAVNQSMAVAPNQHLAVATATRAVETATISVTQAKQREEQATISLTQTKEREAQAAVAVQQAQDKVTAAVLRYGAGSTQATAANQALERAQAALQIAHENVSKSELSLQTAHDAVTKAALGLQGAQDGVTRANNTVTSSGQATATQLLTLQQAQEQAAESAKAQADLQVKVDKAYRDSQRPLSLFREGLDALGKSFGEKAIPYVDKFGTMLLGFLPTIKDVGNRLFEFFGSNFDFTLGVAHDAIVGLAGAFEQLGKAEGRVIDHVKSNWGTFGPIIGGAFDFVIKGAIGLMENLTALADWFVTRLPVLGPNAESFFNNVGRLVQGLGRVLGDLVDWVIAHWPGINKAFNETWDEIKAAWRDVGSVFLDLKKQLQDLGPVFQYIANNGDALKPIMYALVGVIVILVGMLWGLVVAGVYVVAGITGLMRGFENLVGKLVEMRKGFSDIGAAAHLIVTTAWPELQKAGEQLGKAWDTLRHSFDGIVTGGDGVNQTVDNMTKKQGDLVKAVDDTRSGFTRFMTSGAVVGFAAFLAIDLPHHADLAATRIRILADGIALTMVDIQTSIKVAADISRHDMGQAALDMQEGWRKSGVLIGQIDKDRTHAQQLVDAENNGALLAAHESFNQQWIDKWNKAGVGQNEKVGAASDQTLHHVQEMNDRLSEMGDQRNQKWLEQQDKLNKESLAKVGDLHDQTLHWVQELNDRLLGRSIIPDMVMNWLAQYEKLRKESDSIHDSMRIEIQNIASTMATNVGRTWGGLHDVVTGWADLIRKDVGGIFGALGADVRGAMDTVWNNVRGALDASVYVFYAFAGAVNSTIGKVIGHDIFSPMPPQHLATGGVMQAGTGGGKVDEVTAIVGEGAGPEYVIPVETRFRDNAKKLWLQAGKELQMLAAGGITNPYPFGECTWGAFEMFPGMPVDGDAYQWLSNLALAHASGPAAGELVIYGSSLPGSQGHGHVARVDGPMNSQGLFPVTETNYFTPHGWDHRMSSMAYVTGFLLPGVPGQPGGAGVSGTGIDVIGPMVDAALKAAGGDLAKVPAWIRDLPGAILGQLGESIKSQFAGVFTGGGPAGALVNLGGSVTSWVQQALALTGKPASWLNSLLTLISKESGGNPAAWNPITVLGQHATGILQTLGSTFAAHMLPGHGNILNPIDNIAAAIQYIAGRYGSPDRIPGLYGGPYSGYDSGGGLQPGYTMAWNGTGRTETVTPASTMDRVEDLLAQAVAELRKMNGGSGMNASTAAARFAGGAA